MIGTLRKVEFKIGIIRKNNKNQKEAMKEPSRQPRESTRRKIVGVMIRMKMIIISTLNRRQPIIAIKAVSNNSLSNAMNP